ncbi:hypothetical protein LR48_Vigan01g133600 [Vigna angularis]|uniref:Uncharacterized protein n=1 Tax=Phaseolus angularis TaxID=3914 RepID=A0A0L9TMT9_PHAAN|nr:hypothetical protein LR48_Vigan01g133600 [Vigna angularis]
MLKVERTRGKSLSVNFEGRAVKRPRLMLKTERIHVEGRAVNPYRLSQRPSGKSLSVHVEGRAVNSSRFMLKDERYILPRQEGDRSVCANTDRPTIGVWKRASGPDTSAEGKTFDNGGRAFNSSATAECGKAFNNGEPSTTASLDESESSIAANLQREPSTTTAFNGGKRD